MINRSLWLQSFEKDRIPHWHCPTCGVGLLKLSGNDMTFEESKKSIENKSEDSFFASYVYMATFVCDNKRCREHVTSCGTGERTYEMFSDDIQGEYASEFDTFFPEYFTPPLVIFKLPEKCPSKVSTEIRDSFKLFFSDPASALNHARKSIEELLTDQGIQRLVSKSDRKKLPLHTRIEKYHKTNSETAEKLMAIKWLGNAGSHPRPIKKKDVLDCYKILESVLTDIYESHKKKEINDLTKVINKKKGPVKTKITF